MLNFVSLFFLFLTSFVFWVAIFVFSSNPFNKLSRLGSLLLVDLSCFLLIGYFLFASSTIEEYRLIFKYGSFPLMFAPAIWLHISVLMTKKKETFGWMVLIILGYLLAVFYYLSLISTKLIYDFNTLVGPVGRYSFIYKLGPLFYPSVLQIIAYFSLALFNFYQKFREQRSFNNALSVLVSALFVSGWLVIITSYIFRYNIFVRETGEYVLSAAVILLAFNVIVNRLFLEGAKSNFNREFLYSTLTAFSFLIVYLIFLFSFQFRIEGLFKLLFLALFIALLLLTHSFYDWVMSFVRNLFYQKEISLPRVTDEEIGNALRNLMKPENLEKTTLLRLNLLKSKDAFKVDQLRQIIKNSIEYFRPEDTERTRLAIKYWILKLIGNQVEEGQILWDLGFEEYPLGISQRIDGQKPRLKVQTPTDYQATSRNAFISLKKEAIHDLAWRISYLEKHTK